MAREAKTTPEQWETLGVPYVVDAGDNRAKWLRYEELREKESLDDAERSELASLETEIDDLFVVQIFPGSYDKIKKIESNTMRTAIRVRVDAKTKQAELSGDPNGVGEQLVLDTVEACVGWVRGYGASEPEIDDKGEIKRDANYAPIMRRWRIANGKELVAIAKRAWEDEKAAIADIYQAIRERSHLEAGLKKSSFRSRG